MDITNNTQNQPQITTNQQQSHNYNATLPQTPQTPKQKVDMRRLCAKYNIKPPQFATPIKTHITKSTISSYTARETTDISPNRNASQKARSMYLDFV